MAYFFISEQYRSIESLDSLLSEAWRLCDLADRKESDSALLRSLYNCRTDLNNFKNLGLACFTKNLPLQYNTQKLHVIKELTSQIDRLVRAPQTTTQGIKLK